MYNGIYILVEFFRGGAIGSRRPLYTDVFGGLNFLNN